MKSTERQIKLDFLDLFLANEGLKSSFSEKLESELGGVPQPSISKPKLLLLEQRRARA
eukprot:CAMPEP_0194593430 /NCGR_PEP_ID=MMETSP0292-20121207/23495_1 /TAXON_ID=39354 /ORGANISM="Heterosigma akashiwo, Strain CCMP2393" /LENGTH=57 /DNA_ID=CAMNT_0039452371 /DNA_START=64 /DNA_END=233 /DNA_ORIENTATION=-